MRFTQLTVAVALATALAACNGDKTTTDTGATTDMDTDTDVDADADADADADTAADTADTGTTAPPPWDVCADATAPYTALQDALDAAQPGDTVRVCAGTWGPAVAAADVVLVGEDAATTWLVGVAGPALTVAAADVAASGFTITGGSAPAEQGAAVWVDGGALTLTDAVVSGCTGPAPAIRCDDAACTLRDVALEGNATEDAVLRATGGRLDLRRATVWSNYAAGLLAVEAEAELHGVVVLDNSVLPGTAPLVAVAPPALASATVANLSVALNDGGGPDVAAVVLGPGAALSSSVIALNYAAGVEVQGADAAWCDVYGNAGTAFVGGIGAGTGTLDADPLFTDALADDLTLGAGSPCLDAGDPDPAANDRDGSRNDVGAFGGPDGL
ncbi:MAG: hypothetical protein R3F59_23635 [Myxococcota bacterium]